MSPFNCNMRERGDSLIEKRFGCYCCTANMTALCIACEHAVTGARTYKVEPCIEKYKTLVGSGESNEDVKLNNNKGMRANRSQSRRSVSKSHIKILVLKLGKHCGGIYIQRTKWAVMHSRPLRAHG